MQTHLKLFSLALPILVALNASWFGVIASGFYRDQFSAFFQPQMNLWAASLFCILYTLSLIYVVLIPALKERSFVNAVIVGAMVGFIANMTYDLSNMATLSGWPIFASVVDIIWGTIMTAVTCGLTYLVATKVFKM